MTSYSFDSAGAALVDMKQRRRGLKSAGTMSGSSEAGTFVNDIPDYEQGLDFETCDWLDDAENEHDIGEGWDGVMQQHRLSAAGARGGSRASYQDENTEFDKTLTYKDVHVFTKSQAAALELKRNNSRAGCPPTPPASLCAMVFCNTSPGTPGVERPRSSWSSFSMLDSIYLPKSSRPRGAAALLNTTRCPSHPAQAMMSLSPGSCSSASWARQRASAPSKQSSRPRLSRSAARRSSRSAGGGKRSTTRCWRETTSTKQTAAMTLVRSCV